MIMDYEQKYKEALERAKIWQNHLYETNDKDYADELNYIFPELKENEDERIRKEILNVFKQLGKDTTICGRNYNYAKWIAWLEKQGETSEQIHYWTEEEIEPIISDYLRGAEHYGGMIARLRCLKPKPLEKQGEQNLANSAKTCKKSQRMISAEAKEALYGKPAWSEEDEEMLGGIILRCEKYGHQEQINWLKSLKPQSWTKEDKERYISCLQRLSTGNPEQPETINSKWFKEHVYSQPRWKPSKEQINAFEQVYEWYNNNFASSETLTSLYNDLKKLRKE